MKNLNIIYGLIIVVLSMMYTGCSNDYNTDKEESDSTVAVNLHILAQAGQTTRAWSDANATDEEMMKKWAIIITDTSDKIENIVYSNYSDEEREREIDNSGNIALTVGSKRFYSFANVELNQVTSSTPTIGQTLSLKASFSALANGNIPSTGIPMSNVQTIIVRNVQHQTIYVEVVRMMAKVTLRLTNESGMNLTVKSVGLDNITQEGGDISTLPATPATSNLRENFTYTLSEPVNFASDTQNMDITFYINESVMPANSTPQNHILRIVTMLGETEQEGRYALLDWNSFTRNEYSIIPITIDDYRLKLEAIDYPPIGVYPAVITTHDDKNFTCTFSSGGDFEIYPNLTQFSNGDKVDFEEVTIHKESDTGIILEEPTYNKKTNEIIGALNDTEGVAHYKLVFTVKKSDTLTQKLTYNLFLKH